uniref:VHS domain-containing protein n=1 Tax=Panagrellus redivivus TaxID=6233 RepID=A0A7E4ZQG9_PANRE
MGLEDKPIEYLVGKAVDPFTTEVDRKRFTDELCSRIINEYDGPNVTMKLLSFRMLSPDHAEALNVIRIMDTCFRKCGSRVGNEIGKYRVLNQFIRLLSPKYQGHETTSDVKTEAIKLLFMWKQSLRHLEKLQQVYQQLKDQGIIGEDPVLDKDVPNVQKPEPRTAPFEDEEKSQLLAELLKSNNPDDLQAANRLIKSMVRSDEQKTIRKCKRQSLMDTAAEYVQVIMCIPPPASEGLDNLFSTPAPYDDNDIKLISELKQALIDMRPTLFRYASEAAESKDESLGDILELNDQINKALQMHTDITPRAASETKPAPSMNHRAENETSSSSMSSLSASGQHSDDVALLNILSRNNSPAVPRKNINNDMTSMFVSQPEPRSIIDDLNSLTFDEPAKFTMKQHKPEKSHLTQDTFLLDDLTVDITDLVLKTNSQPFEYLNKPFLRGTLYLANSKKATNNSVIYAVSVLSSTDPMPLTNINLKIYSTSTLILSKLLPAPSKTLNGFNPLQPAQNISQVMLMLPLSNHIKKMDLYYELTFDSPHPQSIEGAFNINLD